MIRRKTELIRADPDFKQMVMKLSRLKTQQENEEIKASRITQAMFNQFNKYPKLLDEIKLSKSGKWKSK